VKSLSGHGPDPCHREGKKQTLETRRLDPVVPADEARDLFAAANQPKKLVTFPGAGHNVFGSVGDPYLNLIEDFIREALKAPK